MCEVSVCGWVCLVESDLTLNRCFSLVLVFYAVYVYICLQSITIRTPFFSATLTLCIVILSASV